VIELATEFWLLLLAALAVGAVVGFAVGHVRMTARLHAARLEAEGERVRRETEARQSADTEARLRATFDSLAAESLRANNESFLNLARETLGREQVVAQSALREREAAIRAGAACPRDAQPDHGPAPARGSRPLG
jgi:hypothetical protein